MNLLEVCEVAWKQLFPKPSDETPVDKEDFISTGRSILATQLWIFARNEKNTEGVFNVPSYMFSEVERDVLNNEISLEGLSIFRSLPGEVWLQNIGGIGCECQYIKSTVNQSQLLCDDDALSDFKTYYVVKNKIKFPRGTHSQKLSILYASTGGESIEGEEYVDDALAGIVREKLLDIYVNKIGKEDVTNNSSSVT